MAVGLVAARLGYVIQAPRHLRRSREALYVWQGGFLLWWGVAAAALTLILWPRRPRPTLLAVAALAASTGLWLALLPLALRRYGRHRCRCSP